MRFKGKQIKATFILLLIHYNIFDILTRFVKIHPECIVVHP
jgi:hypothetical protein